MFWSSLASMLGSRKKGLFLLASKVFAVIAGFSFRFLSFDNVADTETHELKVGVCVFSFLFFSFCLLFSRADAMLQAREIIGEKKSCFLERYLAVRIYLTSFF